MDRFFMRLFGENGRCWIAEGVREVCTLVENRGASRVSAGAAGRLLTLVVTVAFSANAVAGPVDLSRAEALRIGKKIWQNECAGTVAGLTSWNAGENFASLGIGHFIWYPVGTTGPFDESFPKFVEFAGGRSVKLPAGGAGEGGGPREKRAEIKPAAPKA